MYSQPFSRTSAISSSVCPADNALPDIAKIGNPLYNFNNTSLSWNSHAFTERQNTKSQHCWILKHRTRPAAQHRVANRVHGNSLIRLHVRDFCGAFYRNATQCTALKNASMETRPKGPVTPLPRNEKRETRNEKRETINRTERSHRHREARNEKRHRRSVVRSLLTSISTPICQISPCSTASLTLYSAADLSYST